MMGPSTEALRGSIPPLICPLRDGAIDVDSYRRLVERHVERGSDGVLVNGTTGEPSTLTISERKSLAETAVAASAGRIPVVVATGSQSHAESAVLTEHADSVGASAALVVTPYYIRPSQRGLVEYFVDIASNTRLPVLVYHIPGRAAVGLEIATLVAIRERAPNLVGIKHAVNDLAMVTDMVRTFGGSFRIFVGLEDLSYPMLAVGAAGVMSAVGNLVPNRVAELCRAVEEDDLGRARALHYELAELNRAVFLDTNPIPVKYMMRRLGLLERNEHRLPLLPASGDLEQKLDSVLSRAGLLAAVGD